MNAWTHHTITTHAFQHNRSSVGSMLRWGLGLSAVMWVGLIMLAKWVLS